MMKNRYSKIEIGDIGENLAKQYLIDNGYTILRTNYLIPKYGEIDIVARKNSSIHFYEVRAKTSNVYGAPQGSLTVRKKRAMNRAILCFLNDYKGKYKEIFTTLLSVELDMFRKLAVVSEFTLV